ncbi:MULTISPECIES: 1-deoxy-D-xylulose-5-phosphate synthase N-terminal domain-containing protein [Thermococcus]|uniref:Transketolase n=1 Tax=Thermococcus sibiricus TaxID=172049 RepID=A0A117L214_9EURY|nr:MULTISPECIES: 1-deoxy-D-xylulose-5-phosphate synthase N-terminal domain-containing protein [Thermococcus]KUK17950.1 MAG: Transketolase [Thermococcus sibiricus]KUK29309.1 MAG: Transketolase [Thermococcus sp. 40_45]MBC7094613.1 transketolase [Thermococcus sp.]HII67909.1 transketolase [Thermococcaceae archaeon]
MSESLVQLVLSNKLKEMLSEVNNFHLNSSITCLEILKAVIAKKGENDVIILSKGHSAPAFYVILSELGLLSEEELKSFANLDGLPSHVTRGLPFIEVSSGSLGQGLSVANGVALASKLKGEERNVYVIVGDGELDEGQIWEAAMTSSHYKLDNVIAIIDRNFRQLTGKTEKIMSKEPLGMKWKSFGWEVFDVENKAEKLLEVLFNLDKVKGKPKAVIAKWE